MIVLKQILSVNMIVAIVVSISDVAMYCNTMTSGLQARNELEVEMLVCSHTYT